MEKLVAKQKDSASEIQRIFSNLKKKHLWIAGRWTYMKKDKTSWKQYGWTSTGQKIQSDRSKERNLIRFTTI